MAEVITGWPPGLLQDDCPGLSRWFASRVDARYQVRKNTDMNEAIRSMLACAGFYLVSGDAFKRSYSVVEVEPDGTCYQLTPALARDGVLRLGHWNPDTTVKGPFTTAFDAESAQRVAWYGPTAARKK